MSQAKDLKTILSTAAQMLEYPAQDFRQNILMAADQMQDVSTQAADSLRTFYSRMKRMELSMWQEFYVQHFDLTPVCPLYVSVHLFGEESFKRAELMAGLKSVYDHSGLTNSVELPDHLVVILKNSHCFSDQEWSDLTTMCLLPAITIMIQKLEKNASPYFYVLKAIEALIQRENVYV